MINRISLCIIEFIKLVAKRDKMFGKPCILSLFPGLLIQDCLNLYCQGLKDRIFAGELS